MSVPLKYRQLGDFHEYYSGRRKAPYLTIFVGGNHEASSHLWELYYGGWVAPNIYYMGAANVLRLGPLRIAGMSGIWKGFDYKKQHYERLPFSADDIKSIYHVREIDVRKLLQLRTQVDICVSHDWPRAIERHGDSKHLFRMKPAFERESRDGSLGSPAAEYVLDRLRPAYWFAAHMHCKFAAIKTFRPPKQEGNQEADKAPEPAPSRPAPNPDEIDLGLDYGDPPAPGPEAAAAAETAEEASTEDLRAQLPEGFAKRAQAGASKSTPGQPVPAGITNLTTRFLALDKCLPGRNFLQLMEIPSISTPQPQPDGTNNPALLQRPLKLEYDPEWLAIVRVFHPLLAVGDRAAITPPDHGEAHYRPLIEAEEGWVRDNVVARDKLRVPDNFAVTAPPHMAGVDADRIDGQPPEYTNPQTAAFCRLLGLPNLWDASEVERIERREKGPAPVEPSGYRGGGSRRGRGRGHGRRGGGGDRSRGGWGGRGGGGWDRGRGWGGRGRVRGY